MSVVFFPNNCMNHSCINDKRSCCVLSLASLLVIDILLLKIRGNANLWCLVISHEFISGHAVEVLCRLTPKKASQFNNPNISFPKKATNGKLKNQIQTLQHWRFKFQRETKFHLEIVLDWCNTVLNSPRAMVDRWTITSAKKRELVDC